MEFIISFACTIYMYVCILCTQSVFFDVECVSVCIVLIKRINTLQRDATGCARSESKTFKGFNINIDIFCFRAILSVRFLINQKLSQESSMLLCLI